MKVLMIFICIIPTMGPSSLNLKEVWKIEKEVDADVCRQMTTFAGYGEKAAFIVKCEEIE